MFALEYMFAQALIFVAFGVGLDPRQAKIFGAALAPFLVGLSLGLGTLASAFIKTGYTGLCKFYQERLFYMTMIVDICISFQSLKMLRSHGCERAISKSLGPLGRTVRCFSSEWDLLPLHPSLCP